jgi:hypothetical protein
MYVSPAANSSELIRYTAPAATSNESPASAQNRPCIAAAGSGSTQLKPQYLKWKRGSTKNRSTHP